MKKLLFLILFALGCCLNVIHGQSIVYADVNKDDITRMNFEILGKLANNILIYKETKGKNRISVYNENMQLLEDVPITILPQKDLLDVAFFPYHNYAFMVYQYQKGNTVYCDALKIEANGHILEQPIALDTTIIAYKADNKIYSLASNNDGSKIALFKINKKDRSNYRFKTLLFDNELHPLITSSFSVPMNKSGDYLSAYSLANNGDFAFIKYNRLSSGNIVDASIVIKPYNEDSYKEEPLKINDLFLDDIKLKIDEENNRYLLSSFYSDKKRGNIAGLYNYALQMDTRQPVFETTTPFDDEFRKMARGKAGTKNAFNDYFINTIIINKNGGFTIGSESLYTTNAGDYWDRWGFWGGPYGGFYGGYWGWGGAPFWGGYWSPYYYYSPFFYRSYWWGWGGYGGGRARFHADNIAVFNFDAVGNLIKDNIIKKQQTQTGTDGNISYQVLTDNDHTHFLINNQGKVAQLENVLIDDEGNFEEKEPVAAKDKNVDFMPRYGKQISDKTIIIPYSYKKNISFAKVTY